MISNTFGKFGSYLRNFQTPFFYQPKRFFAAKKDYYSKYISLGS